MATELIEKIPNRAEVAAVEPLANGFLMGQIISALSPKLQTFTIFPTEKCNFRCTYCYEDFKIGKMSQETQRAIELLLEARVPTLKQLTLSWFGGEPLLASDVMLRLARFAAALCKKHKVKFHGGMTTNAYLLKRELAVQLLEAKQNFFQVTLDGMDEAHDEVRRRADGAGTFEVIWKNLLDLRDLPHEFDCLLRIHVRRKNFRNLEELMFKIATEFGGDERFRLDFQHLRDMGGEGGKSIENPVSIPELEIVKAHLFKIYSAVTNKEMQVLDPERPEFTLEPMKPQADTPRKVFSESSGSQRANEITADAPYICYASKANSLIIRANGRIGKCTVALDDERNDLGYLADDGTLVLNHQKHLPWIRGLETLNPDEAGCPLYGLPQLNLSSPNPKHSVIPIVQG